MDLRIPDRADHLIVAISDIEMGSGGPMDDFPHDEFLADLIRGYAEAAYDKLGVTLIFNGDTFDLLKTSLYGVFHRHITAALAVEKFTRIADAHPSFFEALRDFLDTSPGQNAVVFVVGNHDLELLFPEVQDCIRQRIGAPGISFPGFAIDIGNVRVEHGSQGDPMFRMDERVPFVLLNGEKILNLPWGCTSVIDVALPLQPYLYPLDRVKPRKQLLELLPEVRQLLVGAYWRYWTRDYLGDMLRGRDPIKRINWTMFRELVYRFGSRDPDLSVGAHYQRALMADRGHRLTVIGHLHSAGWWSYGDRKFLQTGCFRDEFMLTDPGRQLSLIPKVYAEIYMVGERLVRSQLVELIGPPSPPGHMPVDLFAVVQHVSPLIGSKAEREGVEQAQAQQIRRETEAPDELS
ncbi:MAG: hypothetical protein ACI8S6_000985 [Myxococcota bacterium]|jgi:hypothetical protein